MAIAVIDPQCTTSTFTFMSIKQTIHSGVGTGMSWVFTLRENGCKMKPRKCDTK